MSACWAENTTRSEERRVGKECRCGWVRAEDGIRDYKVTGVQTCALPIFEPRGERFTRLSSRFPLLKRTEGFAGEKIFDVRIEPADRPHVLMLFMESFRAADVGVLGGKHNEIGRASCRERV